MTNHLLDGLTTKTVALIIAIVTVISVNTSHAETRDVNVVVPSEQQALDEFKVPVSDLKVEAWVDRPTDSSRLIRQAAKWLATGKADE